MTISLQNFSVTPADDRTKNIFSSFNGQIDTSELYLLTGHSGSGKTLLGRSIAGLLPPDLYTAGKLEYKNENKKILFAPQFATGFFIEEISVIANLKAIVSSSFFLTAPEKSKLLGLLPEFGLQDISDKLYQTVSTLSAGMKYRLMLLFLLMKNPDFLIIDEPFASLDEKTSSNVLDKLLSHYEKTNCGILIISHVIPKDLSDKFERIHIEKSFR